MEGAIPRGAGRPKDQAKRDAILTAARMLFLAGGYMAVSMEDVADAAEVSKLTLYSHFGDKAGLYTAAIEQHYLLNFPDNLFDGWDGDDLAADLRRFARAYHAYMSRPDNITGRKLLRAPGVPESLSARVWEIGPARIQRRVCEKFEALREAGVLRADTEPSFATIHFLTLLRGDLLAQLGYGVDSSEWSSGNPDYLESALTVFLRAYHVP